MASRSRGLIRWRGRSSSLPRAAPWSWSSPCGHHCPQCQRWTSWRRRQPCRPSGHQASPASWPRPLPGASSSPQPQQPSCQPPLSSASLGLGLFQALLLLLSLSSPLVSLLFPQLLFLFLLLLVELLLLLGPDLLPLGLLLLQLLQLLLFLLPGCSPFRDVFLEGGVERLFLLCLFVGHDWAFGGFLDDTAPGVLDRVKCLRLGSPYPTSGKPCSAQLSLE